MHTKDIVWAYANSVSQVCVEDDTVSDIDNPQAQAHRLPVV